MAFFTYASNKQFNRNKILHLIFRNGPVSRATISEDNHLTPASVTNNVATLISQGLVEEIGETELMSENTLGRKRTLVDIVSDYAYSIGCEITEKYLSFCIINLKGEMLQKKTFTPTSQQIKTIAQTIITHIQDLIDDSNLDPKKIVGIGIALPGHYDPVHDNLISNLSIWNNFCLQTIKEAFPFEIVCENNVRCMACGEYFFHPHTTPESFNFFHLGKGMFNANIINGDLFLGANFLSGEIGHTIVQPNGTPCECGKSGCLQTYCSETWLIKKCKNIYTHSATTILRSLVLNSEDITLQHIISAYELGDPLVSHIISDMIYYLSITISNVMIINNPSKILFHSEIFETDSLKQQLLKSIKHHLAFIENNSSELFQILPYSTYKGAIGAGALAIYTFLICKS